MAIPAHGKVTLEEYLKIEIEDKERYEFHEGYLFRMSGGTFRHEAIITNVQGEIRSALKLKKSKCKVYSSGIKIEVTQGVRFVYADASVFCEDIEESIALTGAANNPTVVIEVLSKSTALYDHSLKSSRYRAMPSVRACILIYQSRPCVYLYQRSDKLTLYTFQELAGMEETLTIDCLGVSVPLSEIYDGITFDPPTHSSGSIKQKVYESAVPYGK